MSRIRTYFTALFLAIFFAQHSAPWALASSWNPTLLVNTEAFQIIEDSNSTADIKLRFGDTVAEEIYWNRSNTRFQFTDDVHVDGDISGSGTLNIKKVSGSSTGNILIVDTKGFVYNATNKRVGIGTATPDTALEVVGTMSGRSLQITGTGASPLIFTDITNGIVGIGTTAPAGYKSPVLHVRTVGVVGNDYYEGAVHVGGSTAALGAQLSYHNYSSGRVSLGNLNDSNNANSTLSFGFGSINPATGRPSDETMTLTAAGNVGVGTTSPGEKLEVIGTMSGRILHAQDEIHSSGSLVVEGAISTRGNLTLNSDNGAADTVLTFGNSTLAETAKFLLTESRFQFSDDLRVTDNLTVSGTLVVDGASRMKSSLRVTGIISGAYLHGSQGISTSGTLMISTPKTANTNTWGSGALIVQQRVETATGAYFYSSGSVVIAIDNYEHTSRNPHIMFGYQGTFDTNLYRSTGGKLRTDDSLDVVGTMSGTNLTVSGKASVNKVLCIKTTGRVGICSSVVDASGGCTCN